MSYIRLVHIDVPKMRQFLFAHRERLGKIVADLANYGGPMVVFHVPYRPEECPCSGLPLIINIIADTANYNVELENLAHAWNRIQMECAGAEKLDIGLCYWYGNLLMCYPV